MSRVWQRHKGICIVCCEGHSATALKFNTGSGTKWSPARGWIKSMPLSEGARGIKWFDNYHKERLIDKSYSVSVCVKSCKLWNIIVYANQASMLTEHALLLLSIMPTSHASRRGATTGATYNVIEVRYCCRSGSSVVGRYDARCVSSCLF